MNITGPLLLAALVASAAGARSLLPDETNNIDVYKRCSPAVVNITTVTLRRDFFFDIVPQQGAGSGAIIRPDGYIVTNDHVIGNAQNVEVTLNDKTTFPAKVIGTDADSDLAVIKITPKDKKLTALEYGAQGELAVGEKVLAIGNPFGLGGSLSVGVISSLGRDIRATTNRLIKDVIQTDAAINPGNSGGPLLDSAGKLIGINSQIMTRSGGSDGIGFAISVDTVKKIVAQLIQYGEVLRPYLGMNGVGLPAEYYQALGLPTEHGVMVTELDPQGLAARGGLRPFNKEVIWHFRRFPAGGDVITHVDSTPVAQLGDILDYVYEKKVGDTVVFHFLRGRVKKTVSVKLALPPGVRNKSL